MVVIKAGTNPFSSANVNKPEKPADTEVNKASEKKEGDKKAERTPDQAMEQFFEGPKEGKPSIEEAVYGIAGHVKSMFEGPPPAVEADAETEGVTEAQDAKGPEKSEEKLDKDDKKAEKNEAKETEKALKKESEEIKEAFEEQTKKIEEANEKAAERMEEAAEKMEKAIDKAEDEDDDKKTDDKNKDQPFNINNIVDQRVLNPAGKAPPGLNKDNPPGNNAQGGPQQVASPVDPKSLMPEGTRNIAAANEALSALAKPLGSLPEGGQKNGGISPVIPQNVLDELKQPPAGIAPRGPKTPPETWTKGLYSNITKNYFGGKTPTNGSFFTAGLQFT